MIKYTKWTQKEIKLLKREYGSKTVDKINIPGRTYVAKLMRAFFLGLSSSLSGQGRRKYSVNNNFFSKYTLENCYWAGFIAADGCLESNTYCLSIGLSIKDKKHLQNFNQLIQNTNPLRSMKKRDNKTIRLRICSKTIYNDLIKKFNITPKKSLTFNLPKLKKKFILAFIKGYIDGDGWIINTQNGKYKYLTLGICGTYQCLDNINKILFKFSKSKYKMPQVFKYQGKKCYHWKINGKGAENIIKYFLTLSLPGLSRKWNKIYE